MTIGETFDRLRHRGELAVVPYVMAGYPTAERSLEILSAVAAAGADVMEIGVPFSDPVADGVTIEAAGHAALRAGFRLGPFLERLKGVRLGRPVALMSYLNPLLAYGRDRLLADLAAAGVSGLIVPDLPPEEADEWRAACRACGIDTIFLVAPTSTDDRILRIAAASEGFVYAVSLAGTTGARAGQDPGLPAYLARLRRLTDKPIAVGFGISQPEHVRGLRGLADGAVIGSRLVDAIRDGEDIAGLVRSLKLASRA
jgi:tryptophan synthase alpha chain